MHTEDGMSQVLKDEMDLVGDKASIDQAAVSAWQAKAVQLKADTEEELAANGIQLNRSLQTELILYSSGWQDQTIEIDVNNDITDLGSAIDTVRIDGQETGAVFDLAAVNAGL